MTDENTDEQAGSEEITDVDSFTAAFTEALVGDPTVDTKKGDDDAKAGAAADGADADGGNDSGDGAASGDEAAAAEGEATAGGGEGDAAAEGDAEGAAADAAESAAAAKPAAAEKAAAKDAPTGEAAAAVDAGPEYTAEEQEILNEYVKEWPDVVRAEALIRRAEYAHVVKHIFAEINRVYGPSLQFTERASTEEHLNDIISAHDDYEVVYDDVWKWIDTQPSYLKAAYSKVRSEGTADEVADLVTRWKKETGYVAPEQDGAAGSMAVKQQAAAKDIPAKAKQAARRLSVVSGKRASVDAGAGDPADFGSAFAEAIKA